VDALNRLPSRDGRRRAGGSYLVRVDFRNNITDGDSSRVQVITEIGGARTIVHTADLSGFESRPVSIPTRTSSRWPPGTHLLLDRGPSVVAQSRLASGRCGCGDCRGGSALHLDLWRGLLERGQSFRLVALRLCHPRRRIAPTCQLRSLRPVRAASPCPLWCRSGIPGLDPNVTYNNTGSAQWCCEGARIEWDRARCPLVPV